MRLHPLLFCLHNSRCLQKSLFISNLRVLGVGNEKLIIRNFILWVSLVIVGHHRINVGAQHTLLLRVFDRAFVLTAGQNGFRIRRVQSVGITADALLESPPQHQSQQNGRVLKSLRRIGSEFVKLTTCVQPSSLARYGHANTLCMGFPWIPQQ